MNKDLPPLQARVLNLLKAYDDMSKTTYRELGDLLGGKHPYSIQQAVDGLIRKGFLVRNERTKEITIPGTPSTADRVPFLNIPIAGRVSCGAATEMAYDAVENFITVTPSVVSIRKPNITFALIASGESMVRSNINGKSVDPGDYVVVEKASYADVKSGDYIVTRYNDAYNLKKIKIDAINRRFILLSESDIEFPPIVVAEEDAQYFEIEGKAKDVIKAIV